ncbi:alkaline shock response membrane anchor protein AmaP [Lipingzhangella sp. LS1_29]|uniref:Alkaline shock response membrane anchor protein AmaP n=1 Tax=Lipingzhangella rawalii TaxID=2055835 RepID=A0ABU2H9K1_9ACTN|nr:alkaline shock response membrane anchor protein AmaP [Lipingzhangella rawalii]MDS1271956.1 alkaline shock response membrane anchor protein AmaP [Lipingzhangella rawalii]
MLLVTGGGALTLGWRLAPQALIWDRAAVESYVAQPWVLGATLAVVLVIGLLGLRWMYIQSRTDTVGRLRLEPGTTGPGSGPGPDGRSGMPARAVQDVVVDEVSGYQGVRRARARVTTSVREPHLRLDVTLGDDTDVAAFWRQVRQQAVERLRSALELEHLPTVVRISMAAPSQERELV